MADAGHGAKQICDFGGAIVRIEICNYKLLLKAFLAERSQIVQLFQWLLRRRDNFRKLSNEEGKQCSLDSAGIRIAAEGVVGIMLIVMAVAAAMLLDPRASQAYEMPWCALTEIGGGGHVRELHPANLREVRAGGDCGQPRLLHSEPTLAGPRAGGPAAGRPAKAR